MTRNELKRRVFAAIDRRAGEIVGLGERIRKQPEMGFKEVKTAALVAETLARLGMSPQTGLAMTGVRGEARGQAGRCTCAARPPRA
jgi:metal-dependent amidase/aminoacylase/carboxypeptidase family protein